MDVQIIDIAPTGKPPVHVSLPPAGHVGILRLLIKIPDVLGNDFTADDFAAAVEVDETVTALVVTKAYEPSSDKTIVTITIPGDVGSTGCIGVSWLRTGENERWPIQGSFSRKKLIP